jgi:hypothetical protein
LNRFAVTPRSSDWSGWTRSSGPSPGRMAPIWTPLSCMVLRSPLGWIQRLRTQCGPAQLDDLRAVGLHDAVGFPSRISARSRLHWHEPLVGTDFLVELQAALLIDNAVALRRRKHGLRNWQLLGTHERIVVALRRRKHGLRNPYSGRSAHGQCC